MRRGIKTSSEECGTMIDAYVAGASMRAAGAKVGRSCVACARALRDAGIEVRGRGRRTHAIDEAFFDAIDSEEKAYWLGFVAADGCVGQRAVTLDLAVADRLHVEKFRAALKAGHKILERDRKAFGKAFRMVRCKIASVRLQKALEDRGIGRGAPLGVRPWEGIPEFLEKHFWRGVVDGDGSIGWTRWAKGRQASVSLCGRKDDVEAFARFARKVCGTRVRVAQRDANLWTVRIGGNRIAAKIVRELYAGATVGLDRKDQTAAEILAGRPKG